VRLGVERAFASARGLLLYAPAADASRAAIEKETVNDEWFGLPPGQMGRRQAIVAETPAPR
jgi:hypothetical protein